MKDMRNTDIKKGDRIVYGKSSRDYPIKMGIVLGLSEEEDILKVLGDGNSRPGYIGSWQGISDRVLILPKDY